jgi:hypothetical protein
MMREKVESIQVRMADGCERTIPFHTVTMMDFLRLVEEVGAKNWDDLGLRGPATLQGIRLVSKLVAEALTFQQTQDIWTSERVMRSFADFDQVAKIFCAALKRSGIEQAKKVEKL